MRASLLASSLLLFGSVAHAQETSAHVTTGEALPISSPHEEVGQRPHAQVEIGLGALSLPAKQLCLPTQNKCADADFTLLGSLRYLLRWSPEFAAGVGVSIGFRPVSDDASLASSEGTIGRDHSRNYMMLTGIWRYHFVRRQSFEMWFGAAGGLIVVRDAYELRDKGTAIINPRSTTISTSGPMAAVSLGADWALSPSWTFGGWTNQMLWFLPKTPDCASTNDCATVSGRAYSLELGVAFTYRTKI